MSIESAASIASVLWFDTTIAVGGSRREHDCWQSPGVTGSNLRICPADTNGVLHRAARDRSKELIRSGMTC
jgi:hypothetical protein